MDLFFFDIALLYYYTNLDLSINCCLFSGDICLYFGILLHFWLLLNYYVKFLRFLYFFSNLLPAKSLVVSAAFKLLLNCFLNLLFLVADSLICKLYFNIWKLLNANLLVQFLINYQMVCWEQMYTKLLNHVDNCCWQY